MAPRTPRPSLALLLVAAVLGAQSCSAMMLPPQMLRTVCGVAADAEEAVGNKAVAAGQAVGEMVMKPIAIVGGLKAAAVGAGMKAGGATINFVGTKMAKKGSMLENAGAGVKGAGLGVAAMAVKPTAEKIVAAGDAAENNIKTASDAAESFAKSVGDTSVQIDARIDSPIIGHHHKNVAMSAGLDTAANQVKGASGTKGGQQEQQQQQQQAEQQAEQQVEKQVEQQQPTKQAEQQAETKKDRAKRAPPKIDPDVMKSALSLVKEAKMEDCVLRAICDLNCNPQGFGQDGKQVFMNMVRLQGTNVLEQSDSKLFHEAASKGRSYSGKCDQCSEHYKNCSSKSTDLIKMASHIRMD